MTQLFVLHAFGSSPRAFDAIAARMPAGFDVVGVDLPGFGDAADDPAFETGPTVDRIVETIRRRQRGRWLLVGHSRGGRLATIVAARALRGDAPVFGLGGVVLLAASPPSPEPMDDATRERMLRWGASGAITPAEARQFVDANTAGPLDPALDAQAIADLERTSVAAWRAWLDHGCDEDWSQEVGVLDVPALVVAGGEDQLLGPAAQRALHAPVYPRADFLVLEGARHLLPLERPDEVAAAIAGFARDRVDGAPEVPDRFARMLAGDHVSARTRGILARRSVADAAESAPHVLDRDQLETLRELADLVVPQGAGPQIDLAARVDARLATGVGDGWRDAALPPDAAAYRIALTALAGRVSAETVAALVDGTADLPGGFDAAQLTAWFADCRVDLAREWLAHPATMARIGSDAVATGGDPGVRIQGFALLGAGEREEWEPVR